MEACWRSTWEEEFSNIAVTVWGDEVVQSYIGLWDATEYARAVLYGLVAACAIDHLSCEEIWFFSPFYNQKAHEAGMDVYSLLYAVRKPSPHTHCGCEVNFPLRYSHKSDKHGLTMYDVVNCFSRGKGELPRIFPEVEILNDIRLDLVFFFRNAEYMHIKGFPLGVGQEFLKAVVKEATNLQVLILHHWGEDDKWEAKFLDDFCGYLSSCQTFLSNLRVFRVFSEMCSGFGFVVSRKNFNQLIAAYFAAPTNHVQKLEFNVTKIECHDISFECIPQLDQRYLPFKTILLGDCEFVTKYKAASQTLSHWLGQRISVLDADSEDNSIFFKVPSDKTGE